MRTHRLLVGSVALALLLLLALLAATGLTRSAAAVGEPMPGTITGATTQSLLAAAPRTGTDETTSDVVNVGNWYAADVFVSVDISGTGVVTVTPQFAVNGQHWSDAQITYQSFTLTSAPPDTVSTSATVTETSSVTDTGYTTTTVAVTVTNTVTQTAEFDVSGASTIASVAQQIILSADGADHVRLPIAGNQMRVKVEWSGTLTPTVDVMLRNN